MAGDRKIGRNKDFCKKYTATARLATNKARTRRREKNKQIAREAKWLRRHKANKPISGKALYRLVQAGLVE